LIEDNPFPSDGAPRDLLKGGNGPNIWERIGEIEREVKQTAIDVAYIRGKLDERSTVADRSFNMKAGIWAAVVSGGISILSLIFSPRS